MRSAARRWRVPGPSPPRGRLRHMPTRPIYGRTRTACRCACSTFAASRRRNFATACRLRHHFRGADPVGRPRPGRPIHSLSKLAVAAALLGRADDVARLIPQQMNAKPNAQSHSYGKGGALRNRMSLAEGAQALSADISAAPRTRCNSRCCRAIRRRRARRRCCTSSPRARPAGMPRSRSPPGADFASPPRCDPATPSRSKSSRRPARRARCAIPSTLRSRSSATGSRASGWKGAISISQLPRANATRLVPHLPSAS